MGVSNYLKKWFRHDSDLRKAVHSISEKVSRIEALERFQTFDQITSRLTEMTLHSHDSGIVPLEIGREEYVVSLTTFGSRIYDVYLAIESIMQGSVRPNQIILWLAEDEFRGKHLPVTLLKQQERGLRIEYCKDIRSYKKLIPTLKLFPDATIVTIDDDVIYDFDMLERFIRTHDENPGAICASRLRKINLDEGGGVTSYLTWNLDLDTASSYYLFPIGVGGVLYPKGSLDAEVMNEDAFMMLCPYADDVWFFVMARLRGAITARVPIRRSQGFYYELPSSKVFALSKENTNPGNCRNDIQIKAVFDRYDVARILRTLSDERRL